MGEESVPGIVLQMVAADDVGALAALAFDDPEAFAAPTELAGDWRGRPRSPRASACSSRAVRLA
jgi:hypothetical protein